MLTLMFRQLCRLQHPTTWPPAPYLHDGLRDSALDAQLLDGVHKALVQLRGPHQPRALDSFSKLVLVTCRAEPSGWWLSSLDAGQVLVRCRAHAQPY